jgi:hypothetical protein
MWLGSSGAKRRHVLFFIYHSSLSLSCFSDIYLTSAINRSLTITSACHCTCLRCSPFISCPFSPSAGPLTPSPFICNFLRASHSFIGSHDQFPWEAVACREYAYTMNAIVHIHHIFPCSSQSGTHCAFHQFKQSSPILQTLYSQPTIPNSIQ